MGNKPATGKLSATKAVKSPLAKEEEAEAVTPAKSTREYSIIVWGASGFTGNLVCHHIANDYAGHFKWAMAGRSKEKLEELREQLAKVDPKCANIPILTADLDDAKALDKLVKQSDVLISTAGPFWDIGTHVVDAALRTNTHYCDISGEIHWMRQTTQTRHEAAKAKNVKIVHSCGFDSVPSDLGVFLLSEHMKKELGKQVARVDLLVNEAKGGFSGGSLQSMLSQFKATEEELEQCKDPYCLCPPAPPPVPVEPPPKKEAPALEPEQRGPRFNQRLNKWTYPFQFAPINSRVVLRSNALWAPNSYGPNFLYSESHEAEGPVDAILGAMGHWCVHLVTDVPLLRNVIAPLLPEPGDGPPQAYRKKSYWKFTLNGWTREEGRAKQTKCQAVVQGRRDPGYWETSRMVLEAGLCLALQGQELLDEGYLQGGVLTPATAMGSVLIQRLNAAGITFEITKTGKEKAATPLDKLKPSAKSNNALGGVAGAQPSTASITDALHRALPAARPDSGALSEAASSSVVPRGDIVREDLASGMPWARSRAAALRRSGPMSHLHPALALPLACVGSVAQRGLQQGLQHARSAELGARQAHCRLQSSVDGVVRHAQQSLGHTYARFSRSCAHTHQQLQRFAAVAVTAPAPPAQAADCAAAAAAHA